VKVFEYAFPVEKEKENKEPGQTYFAATHWRRGAILSACSNHQKKVADNAIFSCTFTGLQAKKTFPALVQNSALPQNCKVP
jgi:hypothetical protein